MEEFIEENPMLLQKKASLLAEESRTLAAFQNIFRNPDGELFLTWLEVACRVRERRLAHGFAKMDPLDLAAKEALRALYNEIEWMTKGQS